MNKRFLALALLLGVLAAGLGVYTANRHTTPDTPQTLAAAQLLAMNLPDSAGKTQALAQWKGRFLVVNFWATWCAPCVQEMPELSALQLELAGQGVQILGLGIDSLGNIADFNKKYQIGYPLFATGMEGSELSRRLGNQAGGLPFTVLIGRDGQVLKAYLGRLKMEQLRADIAKFSAEKQKN